jgi:hypothetical protein
MSWHYVLGNNRGRGPEALLLRGNAVMGTVCMAVAGEIVETLNRTWSPDSSEGQAGRLHDVVVELHAMITQLIDTREAAGQSVRDDRKRVADLLRMAGEIAHGIR